MGAMRPHRAACLAVAVVLAMLGPLRADDAVWNLRSPVWKATFAGLQDAEAARLRLIRVASQLVDYSDRFYAVAPVMAGDRALPGDGIVPVDPVLLDGPEEALAFALARAWAHRLLGHVPARFATPADELAAWRLETRYAPADEAAADAWAARFLADFGHDAAPVLARLCARAETGVDAGARVVTIADAYESVVGLRPETPCDAPSTAARGSCSERLDACRSAMDEGLQACQETCRADTCNLACGGGSYDQCSSCTSSCGRLCGSHAAEVLDQCQAEQDACQAAEDDTPEPANDKRS